MSTRELTLSESKNAAVLDESGITYALIFLTRTGLNKNILDATTPIAQLLESNHIHNYEIQQQGEEYKVVLPCVLLTGNRRVETNISLYRPSTKEGDRRLWPSLLSKYVAADQVLALFIANNDIVLLNLSHEEPIDTNANSSFSKLINTMNEQEVLDGHLAIVVDALQSHTVLGAERLSALVKADFPSDELYEATLKLATNKGFIREAGKTLRILAKGERWLKEQGESFEVEDEDVGGSATPKKPYDVIKLKMETKTFSVFQVLRKIDRKEIELNPDFQRAFVWDVARKSRLIESILIRIPLPVFYLDATIPTRWSVVDGLQRLSTLHHFCRLEDFALQGMEFLPELNNLKFSDLSAEYKVLIEDETQIVCYNLMPGTPIEAKYTIFSRVNTGGMQLTPQEIRHALNPGPIAKLLADLANSKSFLAATQGSVKSLRMVDRELVLRGLSFKTQGVEAYANFNELDAFLLHTMSELNARDECNLKEIGSEFIESLDKVRAVFGRYAFRKFYEIDGRRSPINKALFEVWTTAVSTYEFDFLESKKTKIVTEFLDLMNYSDEFMTAISTSTGSGAAVRTRFSMINALLGDL